MSERIKGTLLKYDVPMLAGNRDHRKKGIRTSGASPSGDVNTRDVLNSILPPREFRDSNTNEDLIQYVSTAPATRSDVMKLQQQLDQNLHQRGARETGICAIRSEVYGQCFDEIIRQVTIDCSTRGVLLMKVRNEMRTTINAYQSLYESAVTWGMRKAMSLEREKDEVMAENASLKAQVRTLELKNSELEAKMEDIKTREENYRVQKEKEHVDETTFLRRQTAQLKAQLEHMLTSK